ncbi:MAG: T9SS type A sorting domain-containing protein [Bacteroidota bacterium]
MKRFTPSYVRLLRSFRYWSARLNKDLETGRYAGFSTQTKRRYRKKLLGLYHRLKGPFPVQYLRSVIAGAAFVIGLSASLQGQSFAPPVVGGFGLPTASLEQYHTLVDIDGDGDLDLIVSNDYDLYAPGYTYSPFIEFVENTGTPNAPTFAAPVINPFGLSGGTYFMDLNFVDLDNDGDLDVIGSSYYGAISYQEYIGTNVAPSFAAPVANPFGLPDGTYYSFHSLGDIDGDGDLDILRSQYYGEFVYFENTGTANAPAFAAGIANPFGLPAGNYSFLYHFPEWVDLDNDGDLDVLASGYAIYGPETVYWENTGTAVAPMFGPTQTNPFNLSAPSDFHHVSAGDLDNDGDLDVIVSDENGIFSFVENIDQVLPVELTAFTAIPADRQILINWQSNLEEGLLGFDIEKSTDARTFYPIHFEAGKGRREGAPYSFADVNPLSGRQYYRLKTIDVDGSFGYSHVVEVEWTSASNLQLGPSPFTNYLSVQNQEKELIHLSLVDLHGKSLFQKSLSESESHSTEWVMPAELSAGVYLLRVRYRDGSVQSARVVHY